MRKNQKVTPKLMFLFGLLLCVAVMPLSAAEAGVVVPVRRSLNDQSTDNQSTKISSLQTQWATRRFNNFEKRQPLLSQAWSRKKADVDNNQSLQKKDVKSGVKQQSNYDENGALVTKDRKSIKVDVSRNVVENDPLDEDDIKRDRFGNPLDASGQSFLLGKYKAHGIKTAKQGRKNWSADDSTFHLTNRAKSEAQHKHNLDAEVRMRTLGIKLEDLLDHNGLTSAQRVALIDFNTKIDGIYDVLKKNGYYVGALTSENIANFESQLSRIEHDIHNSQASSAATSAPIALQRWNPYGNTFPRVTIPVSLLSNAAVAVSKPAATVSKSNEGSDFPRRQNAGLGSFLSPKTTSLLPKTTSVDSNLSDLVGLSNESKSTIPSSRSDQDDSDDDGDHLFSPRSNSDVASPYDDASENTIPSSRSDSGLYDSDDDDYLFSPRSDLDVASPYDDEGGRRLLRLSEE